MESINLYWQAWLAYVCFSLVGLWCLDRLFFWLPKNSDIRRLIIVLGAAVLLAPASISATSTTEAYFSPAIFVLILDVLGGMHPLSSPALIWLLSVSCIAVLVLALGQLLIKKKKTA